MDRKSKQVPDRFSSNCTINALYRVTGVTYDYAESIAIKAGWKPGQGLHTVLLIMEAGQHGIGFAQIPAKNVTLARFIREHPQGRFIFRRRGHAMGLVDGKLFDNNSHSGMRCRIRAAWQLVLPS